MTVSPFLNGLRPAWLAVLALVAAALPSGCASKRYHLEDQDLARFMAAGPILPEFDQERLLEEIGAPGLYRVIPGDVLLVRAPHTFFEQSGSAIGNVARIEPGQHFARVSDRGTIEVPLAGTVRASGATVREIEDRIADAVSPKYLTQRPSVVVTVEEHQTVPVTVLGAVEEPGIHRLQSDEMSLSGALSAAGRGIVKSGNLVVGARRIKVYAEGDEGEPEVLALPIRGLNVPFYDMPLKGGERIEVERYEPDKFTVVGLVVKPGAYDYPPEVEYNLMQALAIAGGVDRIADPPYATVFRKDPGTGEILPATFNIDGAGLVQASGLPIKPGDVITVQHTPGSWTRSFMAEIFRINIGFFLDDRR